CHGGRVANNGCRTILFKQRWSLRSAKAAVQQHVVDNLEATSQEERSVEHREVQQSSCKNWSQRTACRASDGGDTACRRALVRIDDSHRVRLARRDVHLRGADYGRVRFSLLGRESNKPVRASSRTLMA